MSSKEKKIRNHKILDKPILGPIIVSLILFYGAELIFGTVGIILDLAAGNVTTSDMAQIMENGVIYLFMAAIGGIVMLFWYKWWFQGQFKGAFTKSLGDKKVKTAVICILAVEILLTVPFLFINGANPFTMKLLGTALMAGICEEAAFRGGVISLAMRNNEGDKAIKRAIIISVIAFGLIHLMNLGNGQSVANTICQILSAFALGFLYAVIYLRSGNIIITMVLHTLHDILALLPAGATENGMMTGVVSVSDIVIELIMTVVCILLGVYMLKGGKETIEAVWKERWNKEA